MRQWAQATQDIGQNTPDGVNPQDYERFRTPGNVLKYGLDMANQDVDKWASSYLPNGQVPDQMSTADKVILNVPRNLVEFGMGAASFPLYAGADAGNIGTNESRR